MLQEILKKIKNSLLIQETIRELTDTILEDRHIADLVTQSANSIGDFLIDTIEKAPYGISVQKGASMKHGKVITSFLEKKIVIQWTYKRYFDAKFNTNNEKSWFMVDTRTNTIIAYIIGIGNYIDPKPIYQGIQHELSHFYERTKLNKPYKTQKWYDTAQHIQRTSHVFLERVVANVIYIASRCEQTAYTNGAYQYLIKSDDYPNKFRNVIQETPLFKWLLEMKHCYEQLQKADWQQEANKRILEQYEGLTMKYLLFICQRAIKTLTWKIGRVMSKAIDDTIKDGRYQEVEQTPLTIEQYRQLRSQQL